MAKDTEKLIRQLSLISYLMAERRPVTAPEIRRDVEGYSVMNEDAFARRFYADRSELEALGIVLAVEKPRTASSSRRTTRCRRRTSTCRRSPSRRGAGGARTALQLLDGEFAYAEPLRLALQQISWGRPSPLTRPCSARSRSGSPAPPAATRSRSAWRRSRRRSSAARRSCSTTTRWSATTRRRKVDPYQLLYQGGQFYVVGRSHERDAIRVFRLSRIRGKVGYATKAEHDFQRPATSTRAPTPTASTGSSAIRSEPPRSGSRADRLADRASLRPLRRDPPGR
jgi:predicted DNA-binding transcriptional regulator YafY